MTDFDSTLAGLGINRTSNAASALANAQGKSQLTQTDFLKLMTAQLNNQDPFEPVDNSQLVAQTAQFSSLAGQTETNSTLKAIAEKLGATTATDALSWVGHNVLTEGNVALARADGGIEGAIELDADATDVTVTITDASGTTLRTVNLGSQKAGTVGYDWDGTTDSGEPAGNGPYKISVSARGADGNIAARNLVWAPVASVSLPASGSPVLTLPGLGQVPTSAIRKIG